jgi:mRNA interferase HigB
MRIIAKKRLTAYGKKRPEADQSLRVWYDEAIKANWRNPRDIKAQYRNASIVGNNRVVFNIKGNDHRLVVAVAYRFGAVYIKFVGTHEEYDRIDAASVEME